MYFLLHLTRYPNGVAAFHARMPCVGPEYIYGRKLQNPTFTALYIFSIHRPIHPPIHPLIHPLIHPPTHSPVDFVSFTRRFEASKLSRPRVATCLEVDSFGNQHRHIPREFTMNGRQSIRRINSQIFLA